jgi:hypothetical protein
MTYLLIAVIILVILAPIIAILPSKRQKEQMALRRTAMGEGFSIEFTSIDDPDPDPEKYLSNTGKPLERVMKVVAYRMPRPRPQDWRRRPAVDWYAVRRPQKITINSGMPDGWDWMESVPENMSDELTRQILNNISSLPDDVVRVDEEKYVMSFYWRERGDAGTLAEIVDFVRSCLAIDPFPRLESYDDAGAGSDRS